MRMGGTCSFPLLQPWLLLPWLLQKRKPLDVWSFVKSPYGLMIVFSLFIIVVMPRVRAVPAARTHSPHRTWPAHVQLYCVHTQVAPGLQHAPWLPLRSCWLATPSLLLALHTPNIPSTATLYHPVPPPCVQLKVDPEEMRQMQDELRGARGGAAGGSGSSNGNNRVAGNAAPARVTAS